MSMSNRRDFIRVCSAVLAAISPVTVKGLNPPLASTAERVLVDFAGALEGVAASVQKSGEGLVESEGLRSQILEIGQLLESAMKGAASHAALAEAEEKSDSAKVLGLIGAVVIVIIAIVVAVFTFGAGTGAIVAAVAAAGWLIASALASALDFALTGASIGASQLTGPAKAFADEMYSVLRMSVTALQQFAKAPEADKAEVRRLALSNLIGAVGRLNVAMGSLSKVSGTCGADLAVISTSCQRVGQSVTSLASLLARLRLKTGGDGQAMIEVLERVKRAFGDATASLRLGCDPSK